MPSFIPSISSILPGCRRSFSVSLFSSSAKPRSACHSKTKLLRSAPPVTPPKDANEKSPDDKVIMREVKKKVLELLQDEGPMSRRKMYDEHLSKIFPTSPFSPNPPPRPLWMRSQYTPAEERVYLTMSQFKRRLIRSLTHDGTVSVMTVNKLRLLIAEIGESEKGEDILSRKAKMERVVASESEKTFVWILNSWVKLLKQKALERAQQEAKLARRAPPSRFKAA